MRFQVMLALLQPSVKRHAWHHYSVDGQSTTKFLQ